MEKSAQKICLLEDKYLNINELPLNELLNTEVILTFKRLDILNW